jgi:hypothetical protein
MVGVQIGNRSAARRFDQYPHVIEKPDERLLRVTTIKNKATQEFVVASPIILVPNSSTRGSNVGVYDGNHEISSPHPSRIYLRPTTQLIRPHKGGCDNNIVGCVSKVIGQFGSHVQIIFHHRMFVHGGFHMCHPSIRSPMPNSVVGMPSN